MFLDDEVVAGCTWQAFERLVARLVSLSGFTGVRTVGQSSDGGADVIAHLAGKRWLFQVKRLRVRVGADVVDRTLAAMRTYRAEVPVIVASGGFSDGARDRRRVLLSEGIPLQLWDRHALVDRSERIPDLAPVEVNGPELRAYQREAVGLLVDRFRAGSSRHAMVVMATGLGKTVVAAETYRRLSRGRKLRILALAHTNPLVLQLERAFWPFLRPTQRTVVWNGHERPAAQDLNSADAVFGCLPTVAQEMTRDSELAPFDVLLVDECHHVGAGSYEAIFQECAAGTAAGPFLVGLTATPWRADDVDLESYFGEPVVTIDLVAGMRSGFLANVDYRMYTDNLDWERLSRLYGERLTPKAVNRTIFVSGWNDAVVYELQRVWHEQDAPRCVVFCGTIDHAIRVRDQVNALGFARAEAIFSASNSGATMAPYDRNRILSDFDDGVIQVVCAVDILNEGVDVPDVNLIVFQRVTHSRRIFVQQLGRGLRLAPGKGRVIVLDFVSDIRRFAAGLELKDELGKPPRLGEVREIDTKSKVVFRQVGGVDPASEGFLREWLEDVAAVEGAGDDAGVLRFPPTLPGARQ